MITKNEEYIGIVERFGANGEGVVKNDDLVVFVSNALPGEKIRYKVLKIAKKYAYGKLLEVIVPADERVRPVCPVFFKCGGCQLQHLKYAVSLKYKSSIVADCLKKIANLTVKVPTTVKSQYEYGYRNKLQLPVSNEDGKNLIGFYAENSHRIIPITDCPLHPSWSEKLIFTLKSYMLKCKVLGYNETDKTGLIRHVVCREIAGKLTITLVLVKDELPKVDVLIDLLKSAFPEFSLFININDKDTNVILGDEFKLVYGEPFYKNEFLGIKYSVGVQSFLQVNSQIASKIYQNVVKTVCEDEDITVIDAYSGAGLMTAMLAKKAKKAYGIEIIPEAVSVADRLAKDNNLTDKMQNFLGDAKVILPELVKKVTAEGGKVAVVLDPPRKGCDREVIDAINESLPEKIVYVSCNPSTLARDVGLLVGSLKYEGNELVRTEEYSPRYEINYVKPYDMFPQTKHVECVLCLTKK